MKLTGEIRMDHSPTLISPPLNVSLASRVTFLIDHPDSYTYNLYTLSRAALAIYSGLFLSSFQGQDRQRKYCSLYVQRSRLPSSNWKAYLLQKFELGDLQLGLKCKYSKRARRKQLLRHGGKIQSYKR